MDEKETQNEEEIVDNDESSTEEEEIEATPVPHVPVMRQLGIALGLLLIIFGSTYIDDVSALFEQEEELNTATPSDVHITKTLDTEPSDPTDHFEEVRIIAKSAFVWDIQSQRVLHSYNPDEQLPLASITKLMTALVAYELLDEEDRINISIEAINELGDSGLSDGELFSLKNLTDLTLIESSNDGAHALAAAAGDSLALDRDGATLFIDAMNIRAEDLGLTQTHFDNMTGLDITETRGGAYGSARDIAFLMEYIVTTYPELLDGTVIDYTTINNENGETHFTENTNEVLKDIDGIIASKTGYTDLAGGNLVVVFNAGLNRPIVVSVLGSTRDGRFDDVLELVERAQKTIISE